MSAEKFYQSIDLLRCPVCGAAFSRVQNALRCENGHTFDPSRKGYVNLLPNAKPSHYEAALFEARRRVLEAGFYDGVIETIRRAIPDTAAVLLDAGCGDGTFTKALSGGVTVGLDSSKDAIALAARGGNPVLWTVGDLTRIPLRDGTVDVILNLFSPAHYAEFRRVLRADGVLLKLVPQSGYLKEIRALIGQAAYSNDAVVSHLLEQFRLLDRIRYTETFALEPLQARDFLAMTPLTFDVPADALDADALKEITIDAELLIAKQ